MGGRRTARGERAKRGGAKCVNNFSGRENGRGAVDGRVITRVSALTSALALTSGSGYSFSWRVAPLAPQLISIRVLCDAALWLEVPGDAFLSRNQHRLGALFSVVRPTIFPYDSKINIPVITVCLCFVASLPLITIFFAEVLRLPNPVATGVICRLPGAEEEKAPWRRRERTRIRSRRGPPT